MTVNGNNVMDEKSRIQELIDYRILDTPPEAELDELAKVASLICDTPISMIDEDRQWFKANVGLDGTGTSREDSFCQHTFHRPKEVLVVNDSMEDVRILILLDINMPEMSGFEFLEHMAAVAFPPSVDVVVVTSSVPGSDRALAREYPRFVNYFVTKPLKLEKLAELTGPGQKESGDGWNKAKSSTS